LLLSPYASAQSPDRSPESVRVERAVAEIVAEQDRDKRTELTIGLAKSINLESRATVDDQSVDAIAGLLKDEYRPVRFWATQSLASLGPKATRSLDGLRQALAVAKLEEVDILNKYGFLGNPLLSDTIQSALFRIGGFPATAYPAK
jgi:hypothetical protein